MSIYIVVVLFSIQCFLGFCIVQKNVTILRGTFSWYDGFNQPGCRLLGLDLIKDSLNDVRVRDLSNTRGGTTRSKEYWIGAHVHYTKWIRLRGCFLADIQEFNSIVGHASVIECTAYCNGTAFGLTSERCVCLESAEVPGDRRGDNFCRAAKCPSNADEFCGNIILARRSCVCFYEMLELSIDNYIGNCKTITLTRRNEELRTKNCSDNHTFLCRKRDQQNVVDLYQQEKNWTEAGFACYREYGKQFYNGYFDIRMPPNGQHWVGIFRKEIFQWGNVINRDGEFDCVSVTINMDGLLQKYVRKCSSLLPLLCEITGNVGTGIDLMYETSTSTIYINDVTTPTHRYGNNTTSRDMNVQSLVIGLVGGVVITLAIVSTTVVILRRRKTTVEAGAIVNQPGGPNLDANYDQLNPNRDCSHYTELRNNSVTYDYISTVDTTRDYVEIIEG